MTRYREVSGVILTLLAALAIQSNVLAITDELVLLIGQDPSNTSVNRLDVEITASQGPISLSDSEETLISGNAEATINYEIVNELPVIDQLSFTGGVIDIIGEDGIVNENGTVGPDFNLFIIFAVNVDITSENLQVSLGTINPPGVVNGDGTFEVNQHQIVPISGLLDISGTALGEPVDSMFDFSSANPIPPPAGTGMINLTQVSASGRMRTFDVTVTVPVDAESPIDIGGAFDASISVQGTLLATDTFTITLPPDGDYNKDGNVDLADYTVWRNNLNEPAGTLPNDPNNDIPIGLAQYNTWKENLGATTPMAMALQSAVVPEPDSWAILVGSLLLVGILMHRPQ